MNSIQYTIRNIPEPVNAVLRQRARDQNKSFNQVVVDTLQEATVKQRSIVEDLAWFIGSGASMTAKDRKAETEAYAWLDSLPKEIETFDD